LFRKDTGPHAGRMEARRDLAPDRQGATRRQPRQPPHLPRQTQQARAAL